MLGVCLWGRGWVCRSGAGWAALRRQVVTSTCPSRQAEVASVTAPPLPNSSLSQNWERRPSEGGKAIKRRLAATVPLVALGAAAVPLVALGAAAVPLCLLGAPAHAQSPNVITRPAARPRTINLSFYNADATDVLRALSLQSGISVAASPSVRGKVVTVRLRNVTIEEALRIVTQAAGLGFRRIDGTYLVGTAEELKAAGATGTAVTYTLKNISPAAAQTLIEGALPYVTVQTAEGVPAVIITGSAEDIRQAQRLLGEADVATPPAPAPPPVSDVITPTNVTAAFLAEILGKAVPGVAVEVKGNTLIVTGPKEAMDRVRTLLPTIDVPAGATRRVEIYNIRYSSAESLAAMLAAAVPGVQATPTAEAYAPAPATFRPLVSGSGFATTAPGGTAGGAAAGTAGAAGGVAVSTVKSRSLILAGSEADVEQALRLLQAIDVQPTQVEIEARIVDINLDNVLNLGIQWGSLQTQGTGTSATQTFVPGQSLNGASELNVPDIIRFGRFQRQPLNFGALLQYLETRGASKTLATPRISVIDNEDASIFIGDIFRFPILATSSATAGNTFTVENVPIGIALLARPRVNADGQITMKIKPVVSTLIRTRQSPAGELPETATREADSTLRVRDGETIVIGGLIRDQEIKNVQEVPLLAKIPLFGELFRYRSNRKTRSEVLIFLTPRLLKDNGVARAAEAMKTVPESMRPQPTQKDMPKK